jgi:hypothetical protein
MEPIKIFLATKADIGIVFLADVALKLNLLIWKMFKGNLSVERLLIYPMCAASARSAV